MQLTIRQRKFRCFGQWLRRATVATGALASAGLFTGSICGQSVFNWNNTTNVDALFDVTSNWSPEGTPSAIDTARFGQAATYSVWWDSLTPGFAPSVRYLTVESGNVTFQSIDPAAQWELTVNGGPGGGAYSDLQITGNSTSLTLSGIHLHSLGGAQITQGASLIVDGAYPSGSRFTVGWAGGLSIDGSMNVLNGGVVTSVNGLVGLTAGEAGQVMVSGPGSQWNILYTLNIGEGGLVVDNGGAVSTGGAVLGYQANSHSMATVSGAGSRWSISSAPLFVGGGLGRGTGTLDIDSGGLVETAVAYIDGSGANSNAVTVSGSGSRFNLSNQFTVGNYSHGMLHVSDEGQVSSQNGFIGREVGSTGIATVTGNVSQWNNSEFLYVGKAGNGTLHVYDGGLADCHDWIVADEVGSSGSVIVSGAGSQLGSANTDIGAVARRDSGSALIEKGGVVVNHRGFIGVEAGATGTVTVSGAGSQWLNSGQLDVGNGGNGILTIADGGIVSSFTTVIGSQFNSSGYVSVSGPGSAINQSSTLFVGLFGSGTLDIRDGGTASSLNGIIGRNATGVATVSGVGSRWNNSDTLFVGRFGQGTLTVQDSGVVASATGKVGEMAGSSGQVTLNGSGSQWNSGDLFVGESGTGRLTIESGAGVNSISSFLGYEVGSVGEARVSGAGSQWNSSGSLSVGRLGNAMLRIEDGGLVSSAFGFIGTGTATSGEATVRGAGSNWNMSAFASIGGAGQGSLNVESGGVVNSQGGSIGTFGGSIGIVNVRDNGSQWNSGDLYVGESGTGTLSIQSGGVVNSTSSHIGFDASSSGEAAVSGIGSQWHHTGSLFIAGNAGGAGGNGSLIISDGGLVQVADTIRLWDFGSIEITTGGILDTGTLDLSTGSLAMLNGGILHATDVLGNLANLSGILGPGHSPGRTNIFGNYGQGSDAALQIELGGLLAGEYDQLIVSGDIDLQGSLDVSLFGGFVLGANQEFLIVEANGLLNGQFTGLGEGSLVGHFGGYDLFISYSGGDGNDIRLFTAIPEPNSCLLLGLGLLALTVTRRRRTSGRLPLAEQEST